MKTGLYRHYKGGLYVVIGTAYYHDDQEKVVIYWSIERDKFNVRPLAATRHDPDGFSTLHSTGAERFSFVREDEFLVSLARSRFEFASISESLETRVSKLET
jgi:hypothetical protein